MSIIKEPKSSVDMFANISKSIQPVDVKSRVTIKNFPVVSNTSLEDKVNVNPVPVDTAIEEIKKSEAFKKELPAEDATIVERLNAIHRDIFEVKNLLTKVSLTPEVNNYPAITSTEPLDKSEGIFVIPNVINYNFKFIKFQLDGNLCSLIVDPKDFTLEVNPGTEAVIKLPQEGKPDIYTEFNLRVLSSKILVDLGNVEYNIFLFYIPQHTTKA